MMDAGTVCVIVGTGEVAPNGVGSDFLRRLGPCDDPAAAVAVLERSGIRSLNTTFHDGSSFNEAKILQAVQEEFALAVLAAAAQAHDPAELQKTWAGRVFGLDKPDVNDALRNLAVNPTASAVTTVKEKIETYIGDVSTGLPSDPFVSHWNAVPPAIPLRSGGWRLDVYGIVLAWDLLPWLLPLMAGSALTVICAEEDRPSAGATDQSEEGTRKSTAPSSGGDSEALPLELLFLRLPRASQLALVSTFLGLADLVGEKPELEKTVLRHKQQLRCLDRSQGASALKSGCVLRYLQKVSASFRRADEKIRAFTTRHDIGLVVGTAAGCIDSISRTTVSAHAFGLTHLMELAPFRGGRGQPASLPPPTVHWAANAPRAGQGLGAIRLSPGQMNAAMSEANHNYIAGLLCRTFKLRGPQLTITTSCCSGQTALIEGARLLQHPLPTPEGAGSLDYVVVTGVDSCLWPEIMAGFLGLDTLAGIQVPDPQQEALLFARASQPYTDGAPGWVLAEGSGTLVLAAPHLGKADGVAVTAGAIRNTTNQDARSPEKRHVLRQGLLDAPHGQGLIIGYGLGCRAGPPATRRKSQQIDLGEMANVEDVLDQGGTSVTRPVQLLSIKEWTGHGMGASSALAAVVAYRLLRGDLEAVFPRPEPSRHGSNRSVLGVVGSVQLPTAEERYAWVLLNGTGLGGTASAVRLEPLGLLRGPASDPVAGG